MIYFFYFLPFTYIFVFVLMLPPPPISTRTAPLFPYTPLFRSLRFVSYCRPLPLVVPIQVSRLRQMYFIGAGGNLAIEHCRQSARQLPAFDDETEFRVDRKSTRLNSRH